MTRGVLRTRNLNKVLQELINPPSEVKEELVRGDSILRIGNRLMQLKNDYNKEVFNGDLGIVRAIDKTDKEVTIDFDGRDVTYDYADLNEITLAWATNIHYLIQEINNKQQQQRRIFFSQCKYKLLHKFIYTA